MSGYRTSARKGLSSFFYNLQIWIPAPSPSSTSTLLRPPSEPAASSVHWVCFSRSPRTPEGCRIVHSVRFILYRSWYFRIRCLCSSWLPPACLLELTSAAEGIAPCSRCSPALVSIPPGSVSQLSLTRYRCKFCPQSQPLAYYLVSLFYWACFEGWRV